MANDFCDRLLLALRFNEITNELDQIEQLMDACKVTRKTAIRYLTLKECPFNNYPLRLLDLANALHCDHRWLYDGTGYSPFESIVIRNMQNMTVKEKNGYLRLAIRLINNNKKAERLVKLCERRVITSRQLLMMV